jgi:hypothetical protein
VRAEIARAKLPRWKIARDVGMSESALNRRLRLANPVPFDMNELERIASALHIDAGTFLATADK